MPVAVEILDYIRLWLLGVDSITTNNAGVLTYPLFTREAKDSALHPGCQVYALRECHIRAADMRMLAAIFSCVFF